MTSDLLAASFAVCSLVCLAAGGAEAVPVAIASAEIGADVSGVGAPDGEPFNVNMTIAFAGPPDIVNAQATTFAGTPDGPRAGARAMARSVAGPADGLGAALAGVTFTDADATVDIPVAVAGFGGLPNPVVDVDALPPSSTASAYVAAMAGVIATDILEDVLDGFDAALDEVLEAFPGGGFDLFQALSGVVDALIADLAFASVDVFACSDQAFLREPIGFPLGRCRDASLGATFQPGTPLTVFTAVFATARTDVAAVPAPATLGLLGLGLVVLGAARTYRSAGPSRQ